MELGIDKRQIESARALGRKLADDPALLRVVVCLAILLVGWLVTLKPQVEALAKAEKSLRKATAKARKAEELTFYTAQMERYESHLFTTAELVDFQNYVLDKLELSGARLRSLEPKKTESKGVFKILGMSLDATGSYAELVDFVDRLEHGEKIIRFGRLRLERRKTVISLEAEINAMVKPGKREAGAAAGVSAPRDGGEQPQGAETAPQPSGARAGESGSTSSAEEEITASSEVGLTTVDGDDV